MDYTISRVLQQGLITLLCFDTKCALIIRNTLPASSFEGELGKIARAVYSYIDKRKRAPRTNLDDVLEENLSEKEYNSETVQSAMKAIRRLWRSKPDKEHMMSRLEGRMRVHRIKGAAKELVDIFNAGIEDDQTVDQLEGILNRAVRDRIEIFSPGISGGDVKTAMATLFRDRTEDFFPTGIPELDKYRLGPKRKGLHLFIGLAKTGKTRWLVQVGKHSLMQDFKVMHISLEMSEEEVYELYLQSWFAYAESRVEEFRSKFVLDSTGHLRRISRRRIRPKLALTDRGAKKKMRLKLSDARAFRKLSNLKIKNFPTKQLSYDNLVAYIDRMEMQEDFVPDLIILDYPKLMKFATNDPRVGLGEMLEKLRGLSMERDVGMCTVAQVRRINRREGESEGQVTSFEIGEDYSQIQTLDTGLVFRQSPFERKLGLARILVDTVRKGAKSGWEILITQNYAQGQFAVQSMRMQSGYRDMIKDKAGKVEEED